MNDLQNHKLSVEISDSEKCLANKIKTSLPKTEPTLGIYHILLLVMLRNMEIYCTESFNQGLIAVP